MFETYNNDESRKILNAFTARLREDGIVWDALSCKQRQSIIVKEILQSGNLVLEHVVKYCNLSKCMLLFKEKCSQEKLHSIMTNILSNLPNELQASTDTGSELILLLLSRDLRDHNVNLKNYNSLNLYVTNMELDLFDDKTTDMQEQARQLYHACQGLNFDRIEQNIKLIMLIPKILSDNEKSSKRILLWQKSIFNIIMDRLNIIISNNLSNLSLQVIRNKIISHIKYIDIVLNKYDKQKTSCYDNLLCFSFGVKQNEQGDFCHVKNSNRFLR